MSERATLQALFADVEIICVNQRMYTFDLYSRLIRPVPDDVNARWAMFGLVIQQIHQHRRNQSLSSSQL